MYFETKFIKVFTLKKITLNKLKQHYLVYVSIWFSYGVYGFTIIRNTY